MSYDKMSKFTKYSRSCGATTHGNPDDQNAPCGRIFPLHGRGKAIKVGKEILEGLLRDKIIDNDTSFICQSCLDAYSQRKSLQGIQKSFEDISLSMTEDMKHYTNKKIL